MKRLGKKPAIKSLIESLKTIYNINISYKELILKHLNYARNTLKHASVTYEDKVKLDAQTEAVLMILRAIDNLIRLDKSVSYNTPDFFGWLNKNRNELL